MRFRGCSSTLLSSLAIDLAVVFACNKLVICGTFVDVIFLKAILCIMCGSFHSEGAFSSCHMAAFMHFDLMSKMWSGIKFLCSLNTNHWNAGTLEFTFHRVFHKMMFIVQKLYGKSVPKRSSVPANHNETIANIVS